MQQTHVGSQAFPPPHYIHACMNAHMKAYTFSISIKYEEIDDLLLGTPVSS